MTERRAAKVYRSYDEQVEILAERAMRIHDRHWAVTRLREVSYYRLSGYWYPFRMMRADGNGRADRFFPGSDLHDVVALYDFDARLRSSAFAVLAPIELSIRARLGHELGKIDPLIHLRPDLLGPSARRPGSTAASSRYSMWSEQYAAELARSSGGLRRPPQDEVRRAPSDLGRGGDPGLGKAHPPLWHVPAGDCRAFR